VYSRAPLIQNLVIRTAYYPELLGSWGKFAENSTKLTCLEFTGYQIKYSAVLRFIELSDQAWSKGLYAGKYYKFPIVSLEFFIDISFRPHYGPGVYSVSDRNEYQEYFLGVKATGA
jgi:hypothetical protein